MKNTCSVWLVGVISIIKALSPRENVLCIGVTGGTGIRAVQGLLDDKRISADQLYVLSRSPDSSEACAALRRHGIQIVKGDLEDGQGLQSAIQSVAPSRVYVHGTGGDTKKLDTNEVKRADVLSEALIAGAPGLQLLAYNSAAVDPSQEHLVERIQQKRMCEKTFRDAGLPCCALRANIFMEELWKSYTRPTILKKKKFSFAVPPDKLMYLTSVRDMGRVAAASFESPDSYANVSIDIASDALTPLQMAQAFGVEYKRNRVLPILSRIFLPELYRILRFYCTSTLQLDLNDLNSRFPDLPRLTDFTSFLSETQWSDPERTFDTFIYTLDNNK